MARVLEALCGEFTLQSAFFAGVKSLFHDLDVDPHRPCVRKCVGSLEWEAVRKGPFALEKEGMRHIISLSLSLSFFLSSDPQRDACLVLKGYGYFSDSSPEPLASWVTCWGSACEGWRFAAQKTEEGLGGLKVAGKARGFGLKPAAPNREPSTKESLQLTGLVKTLRDMLRGFCGPAVVTTVCKSLLALLA